MKRITEGGWFSVCISRGTVRGSGNLNRGEGLQRGSRMGGNWGDPDKNNNDNSKEGWEKRNVQKA